MPDGGICVLCCVPITPDDEPFLFQVYAGTRQAEVAAWGWDPVQQDAFLSLQFLAQQRSYALQYPDADRQVIRLGQQPIGRIIVARTAQELRLVDIALLPEQCGHGIGTALIHALQAEAAESGRPLRLSVLKANPALRLYERLGFTVTAERAMEYAMEWRP